MQDTRPCAALADYQRDLYRCFTRSRDALFDLCDALATAQSPSSFVHLALAPCDQRRFSSLYQALTDGKIDHAALRGLAVRTTRRPAYGERLLLAVDASTVPRPYARTSPDRTLVQVPTQGHMLPHGGTLTRPGWAYSCLAVVPSTPSTWTHTLDTARIPSDATATTVGAAQLAVLVPLLSVRPLCLADGGYSTVGWLQATAALPLDQLIRAATTRVLYRSAPPPTGKAGRPRLDGARFKGSDPTTHGTPDQTWTGTEAGGTRVTVRAWSGLHLRQARAIPLTVLCRTRHTAQGPVHLWLWWVGGSPPPLAQIGALYAARFGIEHGFKADKGELLWTTPHLRTPEQMDTWTALVAAVHHEVGLARPLAQAHRLPGEAADRPLSFSQVRRDLPRLFTHCGSPAAAPRPRGKSPGRAPGLSPPRAPHHPIICKGSRKRTTPARPR